MCNSTEYSHDIRYAAFASGLRGVAVGWGTALHAGRLQARSSMSLEFFIDMVVVSTQPLVPGVFPGGKASWCVVLRTLPPSYADCLGILGASASWNPQRLSRPVQELVYTILLAIVFRRTLGPMCTLAVSPKLTWLDNASDQSSPSHSWPGVNWCSCQ
jgi:hypothetical protein